jgi:DNA-binding transcriptional ArsR family regulator
MNNFCSNSFHISSIVKQWKRIMKSAQVVKALSALAQPTRLAIYRLLVARGPEGMAAGQVAEKLKVSPATLSFHFKTLSHAGLLDSRQDGRFIYYAANFTVMNGMVAYLTENCCGGNPDACKPGNKLSVRRLGKA